MEHDEDPTLAITKENARNVALVALAIPTAAIGARLAYGAPQNDPVPVVPAVMTAAPPEQSPAAEPPVESADDAADMIVDQIRSGEIDFLGVMTIDGSDSEFDAFENVVGQTPDVLQVAIGWELDEFDPSLIERITERGALPSIGWEPWDYRPDIWNQPDYSLRRILDGDYDDYIDAWAVGLAESNQPVLLRFGHEANGDWYPWSEARNGNAPGDYVATWHYIHDRFDAAGADNVIWVWAPNVNPFGAWPMAGVFPGDEYVDLVGLVGYWGHFGETPTTLGSFESVFGSSIDEIRTLTDKPIFISETGASNEGGFKAAWIDHFLAAVAERPDITGFIWFEANKEDDWRVDSSPESLESFREGLTRPAFTR